MISLSVNADQPAYVPGDVITGSIRWADIKEDSKQIDVRLIWYTKGKGQRNHEVLDTMTIASPPPRGESGFQFTVPHRPYSFSGKLISLVWSIEALVFPDLEAEQLEVVISKDGKEIILG